MLAGPQVTIAGYVPDLTQSYAEARISVNPLRFGAGVKGKIVASLAAGLPVVTTSVGNEGIQLQDGVEALIADTPAAFAGQIVALLDDDARCRALALAGAAVIGRRFSRDTARALVVEMLNLPVPAQPVAGPAVTNAEAGSAWHDHPIRTIKPGVGRLPMGRPARAAIRA